MVQGRHKSMVGSVGLAVWNDVLYKTMYHSMSSAQEVSVSNSLSE